MRLLLWIAGERNLGQIEKDKAPKVGSNYSKRSKSLIYCVVRLEQKGSSLIIYGKPTGLHESVRAAKEWAEDHPVSTRAQENKRITQIMRKYGLSEEETAGLIVFQQSH